MFKNIKNFLLNFFFIFLKLLNYIYKKMIKLGFLIRYINKFKIINFSKKKLVVINNIYHKFLFLLF
jgi:hypothetical protein